MARSGEPVLSFEADPDVVYRVVGRFFDALEASGVEHVCISPGSRSTPLCVSADRTPGLRTWVGLDERATGFFALGLAKSTGKPVALVCTSGTAAANYLPAVVEAHYSRVPLLLLTADRPPELRDWGAGQTIEQVGLYGAYCRWAVDVPLAEAGTGALRFATQLAARAVGLSQGEPRGPVHLNWPLREPLPPPPDFFADAKSAGSNPESPRTPTFSRARSQAKTSDVRDLVDLVEACSRGVLCVGPLPFEDDDELAQSIAAFAIASGWPILADPASGLRGHSSVTKAPLVCVGDGILRSPGFAASMTPEVVIRLGETPVSKAQRSWIEAAEPREVWWLDGGGSWGEPSHRATRVQQGGAASLLAAAAASLEEAAGKTERRNSSWCRRFESAEAAARCAVESFVQQESNFSGASVASILARAYAGGGHLFASNSMSIRLLDLVEGPSSGLRVFCNRGASGIDGINSTALGVAASKRAPTALLTGDLALLHDLSGLLLTKQEALDLVLVVIDDDGGGIFSFLPIAAQGADVSFEKLFGTPHGLDLSRVASLFDFHYERVRSPTELEDAIAEGKSRQGISLIHARFDRNENEARFRALVSEIVDAVDG